MSGTPTCGPVKAAAHQHRVIDAGALDPTTIAATQPPSARLGQRTPRPQQPACKYADHRNSPLIAATVSTSHANTARAMPLTSATSSRSHAGPRLQRRN